MGLDKKSKSVLTFRPKINFIEPDQEPSPIEAEADLPSSQNVADRRQRIKKLADAVDLLAGLTQKKIDNKAKGQIIKLDPKVDIATIQSMRRTYPDSDLNPNNDFTQITYQQYKRCRDNIRKYGQRVGAKAVISKDEISKAKEDFLSGKPGMGMGIGTEKATTGGLRPELDKRSQIIEPIDIDEFQDELLKILVNFLWKNFIKPIIPLPFLPDELVSTSKKSRKMVKDTKKATKKSQKKKKSKDSTEILEGLK